MVLGRQFLDTAVKLRLISSMQALCLKPQKQYLRIRALQATRECAQDGTLSATFFQTEPASMMATYKGEQSLMLIDQSASGARYQGRNGSFWEHQGEARVTWGYGAKEMTCKKHN